MADEELKSLAVKIALEDGSFQSGIKDLKGKLGVIDSEFKSSVAGVKNWGNTVDGVKANIQALGDKISVQKQVVSTYAEQLQKSKDALSQNSQNLIDLKNKLSAAKEAYSQSEKELGKNDETTKKLGEDVKELSKQFTNSETLVLRNEKSVQGFNIQLNNANAYLKNLQTELYENTSKWGKFGDAAEAAGNKLKAAGSKMTSVGNTLTATVTVPILAAGTAAVKTGIEFEAQMSKVQALSDASKEELKQLDDLALQLGADTSFSASEAAEGEQNLAAAGFNVKEIIAALPGMLDLAASSGEGLASSSEIAATTLRGFNLEASKAGHVADVLAKNAATTNAAVADTGEAMKYIAPVAASAKWSLEEVTAAIGEMSDAGIKGSKAGTSLRGVITMLQSPSEKASKLMDEMGFSAYDANGNMKSLSQIIGDLKTATKGMTKEQQDYNISTIFGSEALSGLQVLMTGGKDKLEEMTEALKNSDGAAKKMAETMLDNTKGSIEEMTGSLGTAGITITKSFAPTITNIAKQITTLANNFSDLSEEQQQNIIKYGLIAAAAGPVLSVTGKLTTGVGNFVTGIGKTANGIKDFIGGLKGTAAAAGTTATTASKLGSAIASVSGGHPVLIGLAAVTTAIIAISIAFGKADDASKTLTTELNKQKEAWDATKKAAGETAAVNTTQIQYVQSLYNELQTLVDKNGKVIGSKEKVKEITEYLNNNTYPDAIKWIDSETISYKDGADAIQAYINKKEAQSLVDAYSSVNSEAVANAEKVKTAQIKIAQEIDQKRDAYNQASLKLDEAIRNKKSQGIIDALKIEVDSTKASLVNAQDTYGKNEELLKTYNESIQNYRTAELAAATGNVAKTKEALDAENLVLSTAGKQKKAAYAQGVIEAETALQQTRQRLKEGYPGITEDSVKAAEQLVATAKVKYQEAGGKIASGFADGIDANGNLIYLSGDGAAEAALNGLGSNSLYDSAKRLGVDLGQGYIAGLDSTKKTFTTAGFNLVKLALNSMQKAQESNSPSKKSRKLGVDNGEGYALGILDKAEMAKTAASKVAKTALEGLKNTNAFDLNYNISAIPNINLQSLIPQQKGYGDVITNNYSSSNPTITIPVYIDGKAAKTITITPEQLAFAQRQHNAFVGVV